MNIYDSINTLSDLHKQGLIKKEQLEAKLTDIVESEDINGISIVNIENYLLSLKKMMDDDQIDENIYDKISTQLLSKCEVTDKVKESLKKKAVKTSAIEGNENIKVGKNSGYNKLETIESSSLNQRDKIQKNGETKRYVKTKSIEMSLDTQKDKDSVSKITQAEKRGMSFGAKVIWSITTVIVISFLRVISGYELGIPEPLGKIISGIVIMSIWTYIWTRPKKSEIDTKEKMDLSINDNE